jgi:glucose 1-dehydrogenase
MTEETKLEAASAPLRGRTALVTGSTRGLGRVIAEWLAREGADIIVSGREQAAVDDSVAAMRALGVQATGFAADLATATDAHRLAEAALAAVERVDILVNNAGMSISQPFWEVTDAQWDEQINVNLRAPFIIGQRIARHMMEKSIAGRIVNISTVGVFAAHTNKLVYNAAKAGIQIMTRNMAYELAPYGIRVNCVAPGNVPDRPGTNESAMYPVWARQIPVGRVGRAEDIAAAVRFFCLPESDFTTGQTLLVDGGMVSYMHET